MAIHQMRPYSIDSVTRSMGRMGRTMMTRDTAGMSKPRMSMAYTADSCEYISLSQTIEYLHVRMKRIQTVSTCLV